jgi:hypothetical protein
LLGNPNATAGRFIVLQISIFPRRNKRPSPLQRQVRGRRSALIIVTEMASSHAMVRQTQTEYPGTPSRDNSIP